MFLDICAAGPYCERMTTSALVPWPARSPQALGRAIKAARTHAGWTQAELAERSRATRFGIGLLEAGHETRAIEQLFEVLAALNLQLSVEPR